MLDITGVDCGVGCGIDRGIGRGTADAARCTGAQ